MKEYILHEDKGGSRGISVDFRKNLNEAQYEVASGSDGPCLVLAGAGSGKTRTLIYRLAYLLENGISPDNILLMTFTNKAAREMRERASVLLGYNPKGLWSGTFHHIGNRMLRMYPDKLGFTRDFGILDQDDSRSLIKTCMKKRKKDMVQEKFPKASVVASIISYSVNTDKTVEKVLTEKYPYFLDFAEDIVKIKSQYDKKKQESNSMDYDDLLLKWKWLLGNVDEARERFSRKFRYIMVDEYQDTNYLQSEIIDMLASCHRNILVVGDDAQSIYSFRGACVENILTFPQRFTDARTFKLETNYRSTPEILDLANDSLINNLNQFEKELKAVNPSFDLPGLVEVKDNYEQASFTVQRILELKEEGMPLDDMAVLFRAHYQSAELEMELVKKGIPYVVRGGIRFFEQAHIKDVLAHLRILVNDHDEISWIRALAISPGIGPGYAVRIFEKYLQMNKGLRQFFRTEIGLPLKAKQGYAKFLKVMGSICREDMSISEQINSILESGYETHILSTFENAKDRIDDIRELANFSHGYDSLNSFLNDITLREGFKGETFNDDPSEEEKLVLSTIHQAKGLEWGSVFVIGLSEGLFPHAKALINDTELEEERRLFHVSATRAKKYLYLIHPMTRFDYQKGLIISRRSRFLEELPEEDFELWKVNGSMGIPGEHNSWDDGIINI